MKEWAYWRSRVLWTALSALVLLSACGSKKDEGKVLRYGNLNELGSYNPVLVDGNWEANLIFNLFEGLVTLGPKGEPVPGGASSWDVSSNGKVYTFHLRPEAKWSDGTPVTSEDYLLGFHTLLDPEMASSYAGYFSGVVAGWAEALKGKNPTLARIASVDEHTLKIELVGPAPYFIQMLTYPAVVPLPSHTIQKFGADWVKQENYVSNGPFMLTERVLNDHATAVKNPYYYAKDSVKLDKVLVYPIEDGESAIKRFKSGEIDIYGSYSSEKYDSLKAELGDQVHRMPQLSTYLFTFNMKKDAKLTVDVRHAISMAVNREVITQNIAKGAVPAYGFVPPGTGGATFAAALPFKDKPYEERLKEAQALMTKAGYGPNKLMDLDLSYNTSEDHKKIAVAVASMLKDIYVNVKPVNSDVNTHYDRIQSGDFEFARVGWIADYNDPYSFLKIYDAPYPYGGDYNPKFTDALRTANLKTDPKARLEALAQAEKLLVAEDYALVPIYFYVSKNLVAKKVVGFEDNLLDSHLWRYMDIQP